MQGRDLDLVDGLRPAPPGQGWGRSRVSPSSGGLLHASPGEQSQHVWPLWRKALDGFPLFSLGRSRHRFPLLCLFEVREFRYQRTYKKGAEIPAPFSGNERRGRGPSRAELQRGRQGKHIDILPRRALYFSGDYTEYLGNSGFCAVTYMRAAYLSVLRTIVVVFAFCVRRY